jgi:plasmid stabilization system protein ParE
VNLNSQQEHTTDAKSVADHTLTSENTVSAVFASENWLTKVRSLALKKLAGNKIVTQIYKEARINEYH